MLFLTLSDANVQFVEKKLEWRSYTTAETLVTTKKLEFIDKKEFAAAVLDKNAETFVVDVAILSIPTTLTTRVHPLYQAQVGLLLANKVLVKVSPKYLDQADDFLFELAIELPENIRIDEYGRG